jgi:hypothetical protein
VAKFTADGSDLVFSTFLGGNSVDIGNAIAVDGSGNVFVAGETGSMNFPVRDAFQRTYGGGISDAFVTAIAGDGSALLYSTYLGGSGEDRAYGLAVDAYGSVSVTGRTDSPDFPTVAPLQGTYGGGISDAFLATVAPPG